MVNFSEFYKISLRTLIQLPFSINAVVVDPVGDGSNTDATLEDVALVSILGQHQGGHEATIRPTPNSHPVKTVDFKISVVT